MVKVDPTSSGPGPGLACCRVTRLTTGFSPASARVILRVTCRFLTPERVGRSTAISNHGNGA